MAPRVLAQEAGQPDSIDSASVDRPSAQMHFQLPRQPLAEALDEYERLTGLSVLVKSTLLDGRTNAPVDGDYSPRDALLRLLFGTGLQMSFTDANAVAIVPSPVPTQSPPPAPPAEIPQEQIAGVGANGSDYRGYAAMLQTRLTQALCQSSQTRPGNYRLMMQLRIGSRGEVADAKIVGTTGTPERDAAIARTVRTLVLDAAPPAALPEPVTILVRPQGGGVVPDCPEPDTGG
ncbi:STN domain-containing protein [Paraburkholderia sp. ZP32-5]|uniref:STN domain-containing protein n=1 Tax=Paraburkholderia sp. ZP32-5 TaxID=2883245 RepID=UPI001F2EF000|nr:STN domain-containing protein [Paraburkholderia sp. ZP32-5]